MPAPKGHPAYNVNGEGGRPKIYTKDFIDNESIALEEWMQDKNNVFIEFFALERGYDEDNIADFNRNSERFSRVYKIFKMRQKAMIFQGGLNRKYAHPMCALVLSNNHNVYLKTEQKLSGSIQDPLAFVIENVDGNTKDLVNDSTKP